MEFIPQNSVLEFHPTTLDAVRNTYNLDKDLILQSIDILEKWVRKQRHFKRKQFRREFYETTLISCKGSVEKAKLQIDKLCTLKTLLPKYFVFDDLPHKMSTITELVCCVFLPKMTKDNERIFLLKAYNGSYYESLNFIDYLRVNIMMAEYLKAHDYFGGMVIIGDYREASMLEVMKKLNFNELQHFATIIIEAFGARVKGIHLISGSKLIDLLVNVIKSAMSEKIANRIHVHPDIQDVHKYVDKELFPIDLGGCEKPIRELQANWTKELCSNEHQKYLKEMAESRTDESLRQVDKLHEPFMGLSGSFRTLTVD